MSAYERVKLSRQRTGATFPLPGVSDCIRYAICEMAEMDDAWLRIERAGDKRNSDKAHAPSAELGQALYMLLSAAVQHGVEPALYDYSGYTSLWYVEVLKWLADLLQALCDGYTALDQEFSGCYSTMCGLAAFHGWDAAALVDAACAAFEAKHAPEVHA